MEHQRGKVDHTPLGFDAIDIVTYRTLIIRKMQYSNVGKLSRITVLFPLTGLHSTGARDVRPVLPSNGIEAKVSPSSRMPTTDQKLGNRSLRTCDWAIRMRKCAREVPP